MLTSLDIAAAAADDDDAAAAADDDAAAAAAADDDDADADARWGRVVSTTTRGSDAFLVVDILFNAQSYVSKHTNG